MKKDHSLLSWFIVLAYGCAPATPLALPTSTATEFPSAKPTVTSTITFTPIESSEPSPTLIPCPSVGEPTIIGEISVIFHEPVSVQACHEIQLYTRLTNAKLLDMGHSTGQMEVAVFATIDGVTDYVYETARLAGCNPDAKDIIRSQWQRGGAMSTLGAAFFLADSRWNRAELLDKVHPLVHEISQVTMANILGSCQRTYEVPDWFSTGLAEYHAEVFTLSWGIPQWEEDLWRCDSSLKNLGHDGTDCIYMEAQMAFHLLKEKNGVDRGLDVYVQMGKGKSFGTAFYDVYGMALSQFYEDFDAYRKTGYRLP